MKIESYRNFDVANYKEDIVVSKLVAESTLSYYALYPSEGGIGYFAYENLNREDSGDVPVYPDYALSEP